MAKRVCSRLGRWWITRVSQLSSEFELVASVAANVDSTVNRVFHV